MIPKFGGDLELKRLDLVDLTAATLRSTSKKTVSDATSRTFHGCFHPSV